MLRLGAAHRDRRARLLILVAVAGVVFAILGMHSFIQGDADPHTATGPAPSQGEYVTGQTTDLLQTAAMAVGVWHGHNEHGKNPSGHFDLSDHCGLLALCLVAVIGGALLLWGVLAAARRRPITHIKRISVSVRTFVQSVTRAPPDLISLSILRC